MANHHPSPQMAMQMQHHGPPVPPGPAQPGQWSPSRHMAVVNENLWMQIGKLNCELLRKTRVVY
jgi:glucose repression mediator protein